jgi:hypothetical protein
VSQSLRNELLKRAAPAQNPETIDPDTMLQASSVAGRYDISARTLDRWILKPNFGFPQPAMKTLDITGRVSARFWRLGDLIAWERAQRADCAASTNHS